MPSCSSVAFRMATKRKGGLATEKSSKKPKNHPLASLTVADVIKSKPSKKVVTLAHNASVDDALNQLAKHKILSAPVLLNASLEDNESGIYMGIVDLHSILSHFRKNVLENAKSTSTDVKSSTLWHNLKIKGEEFVKKLLVTVMGDDVSMLYRGYSKTNLWDIIKNGFLGEEYPKHRLAIFDAKGRVASIVSQSDIVRYLHENKFLADRAKQNVTDLKFLKQVATVDSSCSAMDAFCIMDDKEMSAVGIVDNNGQLIGNLSASDLRGITVSEFEFLADPVMDFLAMRKSKPSHVNAEISVISCSVQDTLEDVMKLLVTNKVHRVYIVDEKQLPVGVVTLTDILKLAVQSPEEVS